VPTQTFDFPDDLLAAARELRDVRAQVTRHYAALPTGVDQWPNGAEQRTDELLEKVRQLAQQVLEHPWWATVDRESLVAARSALKLEVGPEA
jgi:hypothetical protein